MRRASPQTRITGGAFRGRVVRTPPGHRMRPSRAVVREALFNILGTAIVDAELIDLYAGAGTVGLEALSRGARRVVFVDHDREATRFIVETAQSWGCADRCRVVLADVPAWLSRGRDVIAEAAICFLDAPYQDASLDRSLACLGATPPGLVVCEHHRARAIPDRIGALERIREARYGLSTLSILRPALDHTGEQQPR